MITEDTRAHGEMVNLHSGFGLQQVKTTIHNSFKIKKRKYLFKKRKRKIEVEDAYTSISSLGWKCITTTQKKKYNDNIGKGNKMLKITNVGDGWGP